MSLQDDVSIYLGHFLSLFLLLDYCRCPILEVMRASRLLRISSSIELSAVLESWVLKIGNSIVSSSAGLQHHYECDSQKTLGMESEIETV